MAVEEENQQWIIYQNASTEARIMSELKHKHILGLVGLTLHPWCLLLEYAPEGDLKRHISRYTAYRLHLGQRVLLQVMTQVRKDVCAHTYIHVCTHELIVSEYVVESIDQQLVVCTFQHQKPSSAEPTLLHIDICTHTRTHAHTRTHTHTHNTTHTQAYVYGIL